MAYEYKVIAFKPDIKGCGAKDKGWDEERCKQYQGFLHEHASEGWRFHSSEYRKVDLVGCGSSSGAHLVCVFERQK